MHPRCASSVGTKRDIYIYIDIYKYIHTYACMQANQTAPHKHAITLLSKHFVGARDSSSPVRNSRLGGPHWPPTPNHSEDKGVQTDSARRRHPGFKGSATRGSESPTGSGHGSMGGPTLRSKASPFRRRGRMVTEFLFRDSIQRSEISEVWVSQFISPLVELAHVIDC